MHLHSSVHIRLTKNELVPVLKLLLVYHYLGGECLDGDTYIFVGNKTSIEKGLYNKDTELSWKTLLKARSQPLGIDVDMDNCTLFYSLGNKNVNARVGAIYAVSLIDSSSTIIHRRLGNPLQVAVNWISKRLYWCDSTLSTIEYSDYNGGNREVLLNNVNGVAAITLDPCVDVIYWISKESTYSISKMKLDGTNREVIVSSGMRAPNSLVIDLESSRLYWTDGSDIKTSDLEGDELSTVYTTTVRRSTAIMLYHNTLYWAEWTKKRIATCTTAGSDEQTLVKNVMLTAAIHIMDRSKQSRCCKYNRFNDTKTLIFIKNKSLNLKKD